MPLSTENAVCKQLIYRVLSQDLQKREWMFVLTDLSIPVASGLRFYFFLFCC